MKIGRINYKTLIEDNQTVSYVIDWTKINTDVRSLLGSVDLTKVMRQDNSSGGTDTAKLKFVPDTSYTSGSGGMVLPNQPPLDEIGPLKKQPEQKSDTLIYIICSAVVLAAGAVIYFFKRGFKKFNNNGEGKSGI